MRSRRFDQTRMSMNSLLRSVTFARKTRWPRLPQTCRLYSTQMISRGASFETIGVDRLVVHALRKAFPNIKNPTAAQIRLIPAILQGKDILLKGKTGTGKSFGLVLALLNQERKRRPPTCHTNSSSPPSYSITSVVITPHRDLAYQFMHWIGSILDMTPDPVSLTSVAQVLLRNANVAISEQVQEIRSASPQILIATPQALLEAMNHNLNPLDLQGVSTVVVDEADYLLETIPVGTDKYKRIKIEKNLLRHPSPTRQILNLIYGSKRKTSYGLKRLANQKASTQVFQPRPQLVLSSATLGSSFRGSILNEGWLTARFGDLVKVGEGQRGESVANATLGGSSIVHCALVVSDNGEVSNIPSAITRGDTPAVASASERAEEDVTLADQIPLAIDPAVEGISEIEMNEFASQPSPFSQVVLEAIAAAFAFDVPRVALLVLPADASVRRAVFDLRLLGVNAHGLDVLDTARGGAYLLQHGTQAEANPTLLVSTLATTRGLDLPDLTHVFILGVPEALKADTYLHVAGRVGRFGKPGKVIAVLEARSQVARKSKDKAAYKDEPKWMKNIYRAIDVTPTKLEYFGDAEGQERKHEQSPLTSSH
ncbi:P-loop containing nucleoside triphosphate hydrolase protein [Irpex rosettiformis]|uniref:P-loop containing nucleoside triphosphate hydrolase protein n=1 Tax=Irpex rosettiformis TaxID=378272 RepID=A0ACB8UKR2_9APHY|nr:P-loop containing nucleoside triphosphate hydrolase protein [Irpex rosettiformis]